MLLDERSKQILDIVSKKGAITYVDLAKTLFASESTIRRTTKKLAERGLLQIVFRGVSIIEIKNVESPTIIREQKLLREKRLIAKKTLPLLEDNKIYFFDSSTTVTQLIYLINNFKNIKVVTDSIDSALILGHFTNATVYVAGGEFRKETNSTVGSSSTTFLDFFNSDYFLFSCRGISEDNFITEATIETQQNKRIMFKNAKKRILLVDHSKIYSNSNIVTAHIKDVDIIITDSKPPSRFIKTCQNYNIQLIY